jgi:ribosome-associated heat shock protein Hsp15
VPRRAVRDTLVVVDRQRIDKWLWHARIVKTRSSAAELVTSGHIRVNSARVVTPSHPVKVGDVLTIALDRRVRVWRVADFSERRGDANAARALYIELQG